MPVAQFTQSVQGGGLVIQTPPSNVEADHPNPFEIDVPAGLAGELTARVDANTGTVTVATGHGITTSHLVDMYTTAGVLIRKDMTVSSTTGTTVVVDAGSGSDLPALNDDLVISRQQPAVTLIDNDNIKFFAICLESPVAAGVVPFGRAIFEEADDTDVAELTLGVNQPQFANIAGGQANPLAGEAITKCRISNGNTIAAKLKILCMEDATP
jgi:hypothetical protein